MSGYARFHRSLIGHPAFRNDAEAMAFAYMVLRAAWRPVRVRYKGKALSLDRGQLAMSVRDLADAMDRDKGWVERLLKRLKSETMCETRAETGVLVITICNYEKYQSANDERETDAKTPDETRARQTQDTEQRREEGKKETVVTRKRAPRTDSFEIPDWVPAEPWAAYCAMRQRKKAPVDSYIAGRLFGKLEKIRSGGWDIGKVLDKATLNNWTDVYAPTPGRDDDLRATVAATAPTHVTDKAAYLASLAAKPWANRDNPPPADRRNGNTGPPRSFGQLAAGIAGNA